MASAPARERTFRARSATPVYNDSLERPPTYKHWSDEAMRSAHTAVMDNELSPKEAADRYGIPYSTLRDRVSGRVCFGSHSGPKRYLDDNEEAELVTFLSGAASIGYAHSKKEVITMVEAVLSSKGKANSVSSGWWESFIKRHPQLCIRKAEKVTYTRLKATDPIVMDKYFDLLERTLADLSTC